MKKNRHKMILELIGKYDIATQEDLLLLLRAEGYDVTQATVSRDVKELRLLKTLGSNGVYRYTVEQSSGSGYTSMLETLFAGSLIKVDYGGNICVIKCSPGLAQAACAAVDSMNVPEIVGTIAGDDTIFILCRTEAEAKAVSETLLRMIRK